MGQSLPSSHNIREEKSVTFTQTWAMAGSIGTVLTITSDATGQRDAHGYIDGDNYVLFSSESSSSRFFHAYSLRRWIFPTRPPMSSVQFPETRQETYPWCAAGHKMTGQPTPGLPSFSGEGKRHEIPYQSVHPCIVYFDVARILGVILFTCSSRNFGCEM